MFIIHLIASILTVIGLFYSIYKLCAEKHKEAWLFAVIAWSVAVSLLLR